MGSARFRFLFIAHVNRRVSLLYYRAYVRICVLRVRECLVVVRPYASLLNVESENQRCTPLVALGQIES